MTIQEYSNKIKNWRVEEIPHFSDNIDLENSVSKILKDAKASHFGIQDLFEQSAESVVLNSKIVQLFTDHLDLLFSSEKESGNVCFANSRELRSEFRQTFTTIDILDYSYALVHSSFYKEFQKIAIPSDKGTFFELAEMGSRLRKENT